MGIPHALFSEYGMKVSTMSLAGPRCGVAQVDISSRAASMSVLIVAPPKSVVCR